MMRCEPMNNLISAIFAAPLLLLSGNAAAVMMNDQLYGNSGYSLSHFDTAIQAFEEEVSGKKSKKRLKKALKRGMNLVVIDPRKCEVAEKAHVHLQVKPGEDATLLACIIREIIEHKWYDFFGDNSDRSILFLFRLRRPY